MNEPLLQINDKGDAVGRLQELLDRAGFEQPGDGFRIFGPSTRDAVISYQTTRGLLADGKAGNNTWNALKSGAPAVAPAPTRHTPQHESLLIEIGLTAEEFGLTVHQCDAPGAPARWGPVSPGHSATSLHFRGRAFDAAGTSAQMREFTQWAVDNHGTRLEGPHPQPERLHRRRRRAGPQLLGRRRVRRPPRPRPPRGLGPRGRTRLFTFGEIPSYQYGVKFDPALSDDKLALTLTFSDFEATVKADGPLQATRKFSLVLPLEGDGGRAEIQFGISAFVLTTEGTTATLIFSVNGQTTVGDFGAHADQSVVQTLSFAAEGPTECRVYGLLLVGRDSQADAAFLNILAIDAEVRPPTS